MASASNTFSKSNNFNKELNKRRKGAGDVRKKYNKETFAKSKPALSQTDEFSSSDYEYILIEASNNVYDNYSDDEDQYGDTDGL